MPQRREQLRDTLPDPIEELGLDDDEFRALVGGTSIEDAVERMSRQATATAGRRLALV